ncbi:pre-mRNA cleavage and polyadenylation factor (CPF) complex subunit [Rhizina undulata]
MARYEDRDKDGGTYSHGYDNRGGDRGGNMDRGERGGDRDRGERDGPYNRGRPMHRRPVTDYGTSVSKWTLKRQMNWRGQAHDFLRPAPAFIIDLLPPSAYLDNPATSLPTKHIHASLNKIKHPINVVKWTPEGRRLLTGSSSGEFTLWNGMGFNFETIMQAHDCAIRVCQYSHAGDWLLSGDQDGLVKYWQPNFNNVKIIQAHNEPIRDLSFSPTDAKFVTASDDGTLKIWNFNEGVEERTLTGHGWDVKSVDWHPTKGLIVSGSKDHLVKLWDPRTARCLTTLHGHKNTISKSLFQPTRGDLLATCARDQTCRIFDLRAMKDFCVLRGHEKDISTLAWHPIHPSLLSTGGSDGSINHYLLDETPQGSTSGISSTVIYPAASVPFAHEYAIWSMEYHPLGHILCTGSNDRVTRFWTRPRPGEVDGFRDRYHIGDEAAAAAGTFDRRRRHRQEEDEEEQDEADALVDQKMPLPNQQQLPIMGGIPGFPPQQMQMNPGSSSVPGLGSGGVPGLGDISALAGLFGGGLPILPPPPPPPTSGSGATGGSVQVPLPTALPPGLIPPPGGFGIPGLPGIPGLSSARGGGPAQVQQQMQGDEWGFAGRGRAPLPSQKESMREAQQRDGFRRR